TLAPTFDGQSTVPSRRVIRCYPAAHAGSLDPSPRNRLTRRRERAPPDQALPNRHKDRELSNPEYRAAGCSSTLRAPDQASVARPCLLVRLSFDLASDRRLCAKRGRREARGGRRELQTGMRDGG